MRYVTATPKSQAPVWMFDKDLYGDKIKTKDDLIDNLRGYILCAVPDVTLVTAIANTASDRYRPLPFTITSSTTSLTELADPRRYPLSYLPSPESLVNFGSSYAVCLRSQDGTKGSVESGNCTYYLLPAYQTNSSSGFNFDVGPSRASPEIYRARIQKTSGSNATSIGMSFSKKEYDVYPSGPAGTIQYGDMKCSFTPGSGGADVVLSFRNRVTIFRGSDGNRLPTESEYKSDGTRTVASFDVAYLYSSSTTNIGPNFQKGSDANLIAYQCIGNELLVHTEFGENIRIEPVLSQQGTVLSQYRRIAVDFKQTIFTKKV